MRKSSNTAHQKKSVPRALRRLYSKKKRASKKLFNFNKTKNVNFTSSLLDEINKIDEEIKEFCRRSRLQEEALVFEKAKSDTNAVYNFIKQKNRLSSQIGPFASEESIPDTLQEQYTSQYIAKSSYEFDEGFYELEEEEDGLDDIIITEEGIKEAIHSIANGSTGCDGITPFIMKMTAPALVPKIKE